MSPLLKVVMLGLSVAAVAACSGDGSGDSPAVADEVLATPTDGSPDGDGLTASADAMADRPDDAVAASVEFDDAPMVEISFGDLREIVAPTAADQDYVELFYPDGLPVDFAATVLGQLITARALESELEVRGGTVDEADRDVGTHLFDQELAARLVTSTDPLADARRLRADVPYLGFVAELLARRLALARHLEQTAGPDDGDPCVRQIVVETRADADVVRAELDSGVEFVVAAVEHSTGASAARGGGLGCVPPETFVAEFANAVISAEVGEIVGPFETEFGWHLIVVEGYEVDGSRLADVLLASRLDRATITVDDAVGRWNRTEAAITPAGGSGS